MLGQVVGSDGGFVNVIGFRMEQSVLFGEGVHFFCRGGGKIPLQTVGDKGAGEGQRQTDQGVVLIPEPGQPELPENGGGNGERHSSDDEGQQKDQDHGGEGVKGSVDTGETAEREEGGVNDGREQQPVPEGAPDEDGVASGGDQPAYEHGERRF